MNIQKLLPKVVEIAEDAGRVLLEQQSKARELKTDEDFLTTADLKSDKYITYKLKELNPDIPIYSEEKETGIKNIKGLFWIVDPLDGTINYFRQDNFWGVSIALVQNQKTQMGVVYLPGLNQLAAVTINGDAILKGVKLSVNSESSLAKAQIWTEWTKKGPVSTLLILEKLARISLYPQIRLCCSASLTRVASGRISGYIHPQPGIEDFAAGCLIVEKAGGKVTDLEGKPWTPFSKSIIASNGLIHKQLLEATNP